MFQVQAVCGFEVEPELRAGADGTRQIDGNLVNDGFMAADDLVDLLYGTTDDFSKLRLRPTTAIEFLLEDFARSDRPNILSLVQSFPFLNRRNKSGDLGLIGNQRWRAR
jgi:hypothetical protein